MICKNCSKPLKPDWHFCPNCGEAMTIQPDQTVQPFKSGSYGAGVRASVFEVIVRQALAGAPWREICAGPMKINNITVEEVQAEVDRRREIL